DICGRGVKAVSIVDLPVEAALNFAAERADVVGQLVPIFRELLAKEQLTDVYAQLELPLVPVLAEVLFDKLQLPVLKRTGTSRAPSTAVEVLEELALAHDLPRMILEWRGLMKLKGTYIDALPQLVNPETGRVHTCFNQAVAATGRL